MYEFSDRPLNGHFLAFLISIDPSSGLNCASDVQLLIANKLIIKIYTVLQCVVCVNIIVTG